MATAAMNEIWWMMFSPTLCQPPTTPNCPTWTPPPTNPPGCPPPPPPPGSMEKEGAKKKKISKHWLVG